MKRFFPYICVLAWFIKSNVLADIDRVDMPFSITWDVGFGSNVYVVGNHPDLGEWDPTLAHKLRWTSGNVWTGQVGIASGAAIEFKYIARDGGADSHCDPDNVVWEPGDNRLFSTPTRPPPPASGKTIYYYSGWTSAVLVVISPTGHASRVMNPVGPGRSSDETLLKLKVSERKVKCWNFISRVGWTMSCIKTLLLTLISMIIISHVWMLFFCKTASFILIGPRLRFPRHALKTAG